MASHVLPRLAVVVLATAAIAVPTADAKRAKPVKHTKVAHVTTGLGGVTCFPSPPIAC